MLRVPTPTLTLTLTLILIPLLKPVIISNLTALLIVSSLRKVFTVKDV